MKIRIHQILVGVTLLVFIPGGLLGLLLLFAATISGFQIGFSVAYAIIIPLSVLPIVNGFRGLRLFFRLSGQFSSRLVPTEIEEYWIQQGLLRRIPSIIGVRRSLLRYHGLNFCYCGGWFFVRHYHTDGTGFPLFSIQDRILGFSILAAPMLTTLFLNPESAPSTTEPSPGSNSGEPGAPA